MQLAIGPLGDPGHQHCAPLGELPWMAGSSRELSHLAALAPLSASVSAGAFCRPGRVTKSGVGAERGVSDPASLPSESYSAWRAGSLTPRVSCPDCPDERGPDRIHIGALLRAPIRDLIAPFIVSVISLPSCRTLRRELMLVLRCTQKLLVRLKQTGDMPAVESTTRLGDWYGNILRLGRRQYLLFISERSRLPVVLPLREARHLNTVFPDAVCQVLADIGIAAADIADERSRMSEIAFGRTRNRSLLGTMNDFAFMAQHGNRNRDEPQTPEELVRFLSQTRFSRWTAPVRSR